jgi:hypothetical protein
MNKRTFCLDPNKLNYNKELAKTFEVISVEDLKQELIKQPFVMCYTVLNSLGETRTKTYIKEVIHRNQLEYFQKHIGIIFNLYKHGTAVTIDWRKIR